MSKRILHVLFVLEIRYDVEPGLLRKDLDERVVLELHGQGVATDFEVQVQSNIPASILERQQVAVVVVLAPGVVRYLMELVRTADLGFVGDNVAEHQLIHCRVVFGQ